MLEDKREKLEQRRADRQAARMKQTPSVSYAKDVNQAQLVEVDRSNGGNFRRAVRFLVAIKDMLEDPARILLEL
jgi:hypothetical protein